MQQSDLELLQTVPSYHLQMVVKTRGLEHLKTALTEDYDSTSSARLSPSSSLSDQDPADVAHSLFDATALKEAMSALGELDTLMLRELIASGGRANSRDLALYFQSADLLTPSKTPKTPLLSPSGDWSESYPAYLTPGYARNPISTLYPTAHPHGVFEQALHHLLTQGLVFWGRQTNFGGRDYSSGIHDGVLIIPESVKAVAHELWPQEEGLIGASELELQQFAAESGDGLRTLQRNLYLYWSLVYANRDGLTLLSNGLLNRQALRQVMDHMKVTVQNPQSDQARMESDVPYLLFVRLLLMRLGLLQERHGTLFANPAEAYFSLPLVERARRCYHLYRDTAFWDELPYLPEVAVRPGPGPLDPAPEEVVKSRQAVIVRLLHEKVAEWRNFSAFIARSKLNVPYLLFPRQYGSRSERYTSSSNAYGWDFRLRRGWLTHRDGWHLVEGGFIRAVVQGPLYWLGLVELDREENPTRFRLLSDMALLLTAPEQVTEIPGRLIVQPNFELVALAPVSELLLITLDRFAERVSLEHIAQYRLSKASVTRAIQLGLHAETIQELLERYSTGEIPQNVRYSLLEWERQARRVELWQASTLLEVDDEALLDTLFADPATRPLLTRRLSPRIAEVAPDQLATIQQVLWQRNSLPALTDASTYDEPTEPGRMATHEPQWQLHEDGLLQPFHAVLDLYLVAEVERFCTRDDATGWHRITPTSLQHALERNLTLDHILHFLQHYCDGGIPGSLLIRLKLWGGGYAGRRDVQVVRAPLLRLSAHMLHDLQSDDALSPLLGSAVEPQSSFVHIDESNLPAILQLLRERGFNVEDDF